MKYSQNALTLAVMAVGLVAGLSIQASADALILDSSLTISVPATYDSLIVQSHGRLTADAPVIVLGSLTIDSGGVVTHSLRLVEGLVLDVSGTLQISVGGLIDLNAKGLRGGLNGSVFGVDGESYDSLGQIVVGAKGGPPSGNQSGAGASYGGLGANSEVATGLPYGLLEEPVYLGAGGGGAVAGSRPGGHGGGRATITVTNLVVDGTIRANGGNGVGANPQSGGGSGGSIKIQAGTLSGMGSIEAVGGLGFNSFPTPSGSGGGGRIAIFYGSNSLLSSHISARGGGGVRPGSAGTVYLKDDAATYGDLIVDNGNVSSSLFTPLMTDVSRLQSVSVTNVGKLAVDSSVTLAITNPGGWDLNIASGAVVELVRQSVFDATTVRVNNGTLNAHISLGFADGASLELSGGGMINVSDSAVMSLGYFTPVNLQSGTLNIPSGCRLDVAANSVTVGNHVTLVKDGTFGVSDQLASLTIDSGGLVTHSVRHLDGLVLDVGSTLNVRSGGLIDLTAKGLRGGQNGSVFGNDGEAFDSLGQIAVGAKGGPGSGNQSGAGASYGGLGANSEVATGVPYGLLEEPVSLGAGGGGAVAGSRPGGHGGGRATITASTVIIDGTIRANGGAGVGANPQSGGGSGGSIRIDVGNLSGAGSIEAVGGLGVNSFPTPSGSGGGGRIAVFYGSSSFLRSHISARGGGGVRPGSAGTIFLKDSAETHGDLIVDNGNITTTLFTPLMTDGTRLQSVLVANLGKLVIDSLETLAIANPSGFDLNLESGGVVELARQSVLDATTVRVNNGTLNARISLGFPDGASLELSGGGAINVTDSAVMSLGYFSPANLQAGTLSVAAGCRLDVATDNVTVGSGLTLVKDGSFGISDQLAGLVIESGGVVTHSVRLEQGLVLDIAGTLEIRPGGRIDLNAKGLRGGNNGSAFGVDGEAYDSLGQIVAGAKGGPSGANPSGAGASYGGLGANSELVTNAPYGLLETASYLGAGGGGATIGPRAGGHGGGRATITAAGVIVDGTIRANGGDGVGANPQSGGGSGGSVRIEAGELSGTGTIEAVGGLGVNSFPTPSGSGGGGRIAVFYGSSSFGDGQYWARGGAGVRPGSAGTVYLKDSSETYGNLIIDNGGAVTSLRTPLATTVTGIDDLLISNAGRLLLADSFLGSWDSAYVGSGGLLAAEGALHIRGGSTYLNSGALDADSAILMDSGLLTGRGLLYSNLIVQGGELRVSDSLTVQDSICLNGGTLTGNGFVLGSIRNSSRVDPGTSYGVISVYGGYVQTADGELALNISGPQEGTAFDKLRVIGDVALDGRLSIAFDSGYMPSSGNRFQLMRFDDLNGSFSSVTDLDSSLALARIDTNLVLIAGENTVMNSVADKAMILSPSGNTPFSVYLRDAENLPVAGADNVWLDFRGVVGLTWCGTEPLWPIITPRAVTDAEGKAVFSVRAGGCSVDSVSVMTSFGLIDKVPIRSLDVSCGLLVTARDFQGEACNDYNLDGVTNAADWTFFEKYLGLNCLDEAGNYALLDVYTEPGPHDIYQNDTIQICAKISNTSGESTQLDSVDFLSAGWGIARPWTSFARTTNTTLDAHDSVVIKHPFVVPESHHGCFKVRMYPRFLTRQSAAPRRTLGGDIFTTSLSGFSVDGATVSQIIRTLRRVYDLPVSFIQAAYEKPLHLGVFEGTVPRFLDLLADQDPRYRYETLRGRIVVYPDDAAYDREVTGIEQGVHSRQAATGLCVQLLRKQIAAFADLVPPGLMGNPEATLYKDEIVLSDGGRVIERLVELLGDDASLSFAVQPAASGHPGLAFYRQRSASYSPTGCSDCRPTGITEGSANFVPCGPDSCGSVLLADITGVTVQCCPGDTKCDCEGGLETEEVTTVGDCYTGSVETGDGCKIAAGGAIQDCMDEYALCIPREAWPQDSCKQTLIQNIKVCDHLVQTIKITWTLRNSGGNCSAGTPTREFGAPKPPPSCDSTPPVERQINRDAPKQPRAGVASTAAGLQGTSHFDIPIGSEYGDSLYLFRVAFMPDGWSYSVTDSGWIHVPDTIGVDITHPDEIPDEDTGRVIFYAYNDRDVSAGNAEVLVYNPDPIVGVDEPGAEALPVTFELSQNYPNPFNPVTAIEYKVPTRSQVTIEIFNVLGQKVRTLVNETKSPGLYGVEWDGLDNANMPVSTGVYLYRFQAGDVVQTKKMLLIK